MIRAKPTERKVNPIWIIMGRGSRLRDHAAGAEGRGGVRPGRAGRPSSPGTQPDTAACLAACRGQDYSTIDLSDLLNRLRGEGGMVTAGGLMG